MASLSENPVLWDKQATSKSSTDYDLPLTLSHGQGHGLFLPQRRRGEPCLCRARVPSVSLCVCTCSVESVRVCASLPCMLCLAVLTPMCLPRTLCLYNYTALSLFVCSSSRLSLLSGHHFLLFSNLLCDLPGISAIIATMITATHCVRNRASATTLEIYVQDSLRTEIFRRPYESHIPGLL
jgi:hypothetical protein